MPIKQVVINASPLITLFASNQQYILSKLFNEIIVPEEVWEEVIESGHFDQAAKEIPNTPWLLKTKVETLSPVVMSWDLGKGETAVISYAAMHSEYHVIIDDEAALRCAKTLSIKSLGTLGILLLAKRRGVIDSVSPAIKQLQNAGLWLGENLISIVLKEAGE